MNDFLNDFLAYKPEGDAAIWKSRADNLATVLLIACQLIHSIVKRK